MTDLGKILITWKCEYNNDTTYEKLDAVSKDGSSYLCLASCKGIAVTDTTKWAKIANKGLDGEVHWNNFTEAEKNDILSKINNESLGYTNIGGFYVTDESGNVVMKYDSNGFDVVSLSTHFQQLVQAIEGLGLALGETATTAYAGDKGKQVADKVAKLETNLNGITNTNGLDSTSLSSHLISLIKAIDGLGLELGITSTTAFAGDKGQQLVNKVASMEIISEYLAQVSEGYYSVVDEDGNIAMKYDTNGLDVVALSNHFKSLITNIDGLGLSIGTTSGTAYEGSKGLTLEQSVTALTTRINTLVNGDTTSAIDTFNEIVEFLSGIEDTSTLSSIVNGLKSYTDTQISAYTPLVNFQSLQTIVNGLREVIASITENGFHVADESGNTILKCDENGLDAALLSTHFKNLIKDIKGVGLALGETSTTAFSGSRGKTLEAKVAALESGKSNNSSICEVDEDGIYFVDENGNIGMMYNSNGLDFAEFSTHAVSVLSSKGIGGSNLTYEVIEKIN